MTPPNQTSCVPIPAGFHGLISIWSLIFCCPFSPSCCQPLSRQSQYATCCATIAGIPRIATLIPIKDQKANTTRDRGKEAQFLPEYLIPFLLFGGFY